MESETDTKIRNPPSDRPPKRWYERTSVTLCVAAGLIVLGLGFIHVIVGGTSTYGLPFEIVRKDRFGYRETLVDAPRIQALSYVAATRRYPRGIRALQKAGDFPSGPEFEATVRAEQRANIQRWLSVFEAALGPPDPPWPDQLRTEEQVPPGDPEDARAQNQRGVTLARQGEYQAALAAFTRAIRRDPTYVDAFHNRALVYTALGNLGAAASDFGKVLEIRPEFVEGYIRQASLHTAMNDHDQAIADLTKALEIDPRCAKAYFRRSLAYYTKGAYREAWDDVHRIQSLHAPVLCEFVQALRDASGLDESKPPPAASR